MEQMKKEYPDHKQRVAICFSQWKKGKKESIFSSIGGYEFKEGSDGSIEVVKGYIATTHLDSGFEDRARGVYVRDRIAKETLESWANEINSGNPRSNKVSVHHDRKPRVVGTGMKGTARVDSLPDGEYGLWVETVLNKADESYNSIAYEVDAGHLDSFSIEFTTKDPMTGEYIDGAVVESDAGNGVMRTLLPEAILEGWTLASRPMNEYAMMVKEAVAFKTQNQSKIKSTKKEGQAMTEPKVEVKTEVPAPKPEAKVDASVVVEKKETDIPSEEKEAFERFKKMEADNRKANERKELIETLKTEVKGELEKMKVNTEVKVNTDSAKFESKEYLEYKDALDPKSELTIEQKFKYAARYAESKGLFDKVGTSAESKASAGRFNYHEFKNRDGKSVIEFKSLGLTSNQNTDTDYLLSAAELSDVFDPVIYNLLNQATTTWNILPKDDYSNKGNHMVQFTAKTTANTTAGFYLGNAVSTGKVGRLKYETKFKKCAVGVEVDGDMIAAARGGPIGDVFAQEVMDSTMDMMAVINAALFAEVGLETASAPIGFEYISDSAGNATLYNLTRSTTNLLSPASAADTYIDGASGSITPSLLRQAIRQAVNEGASVNNLVFITAPVQVDMLKGVYDAAQRLVPTSSRFGFEGRPEFEGVPVFGDKDCNTDDWWLIDMETHRIAMWVPPTLEMLGKAADSQAGFIKTYFAVYNRAPRRLVQIYSCATS